MKAPESFFGTVTVPAGGGLILSRQQQNQSVTETSQFVTYLLLTVTGAIRGLPIQLQDSQQLAGLPAELEVRGEIYMTSQDFGVVRWQWSCRWQALQMKLQDAITNKMPSFISQQQESWAR
jgi:hypothetical protein